MTPQAAPQVNLGRADQVQASRARAVDLQVMMTTVHGVLMMEDGQTALTLDVSSLLFVDTNINPVVDLVVLL